MLRLEKRPVPSKFMRLASPLIAALAMFFTGLLIFLILGKDPLEAFKVFFVQPASTRYGIGELLLKATPLILCALGLSLGFRASIWNIGAEGQLTMGAIAGSSVAFAISGLDVGPAGGIFGGHWILVLMLLGGMLGGMVWAAIPAFLRTRFNTNEILVSLMLVYIAMQFLSWVTHGPFRDPHGFNFPQSRTLTQPELLPILLSGTRLTWAFPLTLVLAAASWFFTQKTYAGYRMQVAGLAPGAAAYAGFSEKGNIWLALLLSGATAGLAGVCEVAGPIGQLQPIVSPGYGFAAIIVAFVGRQNALGIVLSGLLMSLLYLGGEEAQLSLALPSSITGMFQGLLLFYLLGADLFVTYRFKNVAAAPKNSPANPPHSKAAETANPAMMESNAVAAVNPIASSVAL